MKHLSDFKCPTCNNVFEAWVNFSAPDPVRCPDCEFPSNRLITGGNFSLDGTDLAFPTSADKWAKRHRNANKSNLKDLGLPI